MEASAHGEPWAVKKVPQSVGREFADADEEKARKKKSTAEMLYHNSPTLKHS